MNIKQSIRCSVDFMDFTKPDAKNRVFVDLSCQRNCEYKTMCLKIRGIVEARLNGGLK